MAMPRKYSTKDAPVVGSVIEHLEWLNEFLHGLGRPKEGDECQDYANKLYDYLARNMHRRSLKTEVERKARNITILNRGLEKRIAQLEAKLLLIRTSTDLSERGVLTSGDPHAGGIQRRMKRRIDWLEAKLLIIREMSDTNEAVKGHQPSRVGAPARQIHDARIRVDVEKGLRGRVRRTNPEKAKALIDLTKPKGEIAPIEVLGDQAYK